MGGEIDDGMFRVVSSGVGAGRQIGGLAFLNGDSPNSGRLEAQRFRKMTKRSWRGDQIAIVDGQEPRIFGKRAKSKAEDLAVFDPLGMNLPKQQSRGLHRVG